VLTIGAIHGGSRNNIIPPEVRMSINLRFNSAEVRDAMEAAVRRILAGIAQAAGVPEDLAPVVTPVTDPLPPLVNDPHLTARVMQAIARELGKTNVVEIGHLTGSEDFGVYREALPSLRLCTFRLGVADPARARPAGTGSREPPDLHSSRFAPVAGPAIRTGVTAMAAAALDLLGSGEG
jgi:hippurate hydrolase